MRVRELFIFFLFTLALSRKAIGCPFCDAGGVDAAKFILAVFVPAFAAGLLVLLAIRKANRKLSTKNPAEKFFEAQGVRK